MHKKALIIFAKQPIPGEVKTRLIPHLSPHEAALLYQLMLTDILDKTECLEEVDRILFYAGDQAAGDYFRGVFPAFPLRPQEGDDLGSRMEAAFARAFAMGYQAAAIIGTDSPDLPVAFIEDAFRLLEKSGTQAVFGPAEDGGYYLIAMKRLHRELFRGISWSTGQVFRQSMEKAGSLGLGVATLPPWHDVDTFEDLARPELRDEGNRAPRTRGFVERLGK